MIEYVTQLKKDIKNIDTFLDFLYFLNNNENMMAKAELYKAKARILNCMIKIEDEYA